jgi:hypothetical protein
VCIGHRLPEPGRGEPAVYRVCTREQFLPAHFDRSVREIVNRASHERARRIYAIELQSQQVIAVLSYHLHDSPGRPLLITALGARIDADATSELYARSLAVVWLLKQSVQPVAHRLACSLPHTAHSRPRSSTRHPAYMRLYRIPL